MPRTVPGMYKIRVFGLVAAAFAVATLIAPVAGANASSYETITIASALGSGHSYTGTVYCDGSFSATGTTATTYTEAVLGTVSATSLSFTSSYDRPVSGTQYGFGVQGAAITGSIWAGTYAEMQNDIVASTGPITGTVSTSSDPCAPTQATLVVASIVGSSHLYTGELCSDGSFTASGNTTGAGPKTYPESVTGSLTATAISYTSVYANAPVDDGTGLWSSYSYVASGTRTGATGWSGSFQVTKGGSIGTYAQDAGPLTGTVTIVGTPRSCGSPPVPTTCAAVPRGNMLPPISLGAQRSDFKQGNTVPVKVAGSCTGGTVAGLTNLKVTISAGADLAAGLVVGTPTSTSVPTTGTVMRYGDGQYIYNLSTKPLSAGTYTIRVSNVWAGGTYSTTASIDLKK
jgi:hypothetical protein